MNKPKILVIGPSAKATSGGWGRFTHELVTGLHNTGWEVTTCFDRSAEGAKLIQAKGWFGYIRNMFRAWKIAQDVDVILSMDIFPFGLYAWFAATFRGISYATVANGTYGAGDFKGKKGKRWIRALILRNAAAILPISHYTAQQVVGHEPSVKDKTHVILLGLSHLPTLKEHDIEKLKIKFQWMDKFNPKIVTVGAVKDRKGQLETAKAMKKILEKYPNAAYLMVGADNHRSYVKYIESYAIEHGYNDRVHVVENAYTDEDLAYIYSQCDVFVLASQNKGSHFEGFGLVVLEANSFGLPAVGTKDCGIEDAISDGENGILVPQRNPDAIANAVIELLDGGGKKIYGETCKRWAHSFSWEKTVERYEDVLRRTIKR